MAGDVSHPPDLFKDRLQYIEVTLDELIKEVSDHYAELNQRADIATSTAGKRAAVIADKLGSIQKAIKELETLVFGESRYMLPSLTEQIKRIAAAVEEMQKEKAAEANWRRGVTWALTLFGVTSVGTMVSFLSQLWG